MASTGSKMAPPTMTMPDLGIAWGQVICETLTEHLRAKDYLK